MKKTLILTTEQINRLMTETYTYTDVDPGEVQTLAQQNPNAPVKVFSTSGGNGGKEVKMEIKPEPGKPIEKAVQDAATDARKKFGNSNLRATGYVPAEDVADSGVSPKTLGDIGSANDGNPDTTPDSQMESRFSKKDIMEMRLKYLNENTETYAKKDLYNRRGRR